MFGIRLGRKWFLIMMDVGMFVGYLTTLRYLGREEKTS